MRSRPKLSGAPLAYALAKVDGSTDPYASFGKALWSDEGAAQVVLKELVFLRTSIVNQCPTWLTGHVVSARRRGITDAEIDALDAPETWDQTFDGPARAALRLADSMCGDDSHALDPELVGELRSHFSEAELAELILVAGQANLNNRAGNAAKQLLGPAGQGE